jgi:hypothetical protein
VRGDEHLREDATLCILLQLPRGRSRVESVRQTGNKGYHNGRFYANTSLDMATLVIDPATCVVETVVPRLRGDELYGVHGDYLAQSHGKLLRAIKRSRSGGRSGVV